MDPIYDCSTVIIVRPRKLRQASTLFKSIGYKVLTHLQSRNVYGDARYIAESSVSKPIMLLDGFAKASPRFFVLTVYNPKEAMIDIVEVLAAQKPKFLIEVEVLDGNIIITFPEVLVDKMALSRKIVKYK